MKVIQYKSRLWFLSAIILCGLIASSFTLKKNKMLSVQPTGAFTATLNDSTQLSWTSGYYDTLNGGGAISVYAMSGSNVVMRINLPSAAVGTYIINARDISAKYFVSSEDVRVAITGTVTISANANNAISGTFSFTDGLMENGVSITNGVFSNITLQ